MFNTSHVVSPVKQPLSNAAQSPYRKALWQCQLAVPPMHRAAVKMALSRMEMGTDEAEAYQWAANIMVQKAKSGAAAAKAFAAVLAQHGIATR